MKKGKGWWLTTKYEEQERMCSSAMDLIWKGRRKVRKGNLEIKKLDLK
jgi:hypothetical protein